MTTSIILCGDRIGSFLCLLFARFHLRVFCPLILSWAYKDQDSGGGAFEGKQIGEKMQEKEPSGSSSDHQKHPNL